jgi:hypothetical protein
MMLGWVGYALGLEGWCLWRDYDVTLGQLMSPAHPYHGAWPPAKIPAGQTWPGGTTTSTASGQAPPPATAAAAGSRSAQIIKTISELPGFGFIKLGGMAWRAGPGTFTTS